MIKENRLWFQESSIPLPATDWLHNLGYVTSRLPTPFPELENGDDGVYLTGYLHY